jgi:hypothetical protein
MVREPWRGRVPLHLTRRQAVRAEQSAALAPDLGGARAGEMSRDHDLDLVGRTCEQSLLGGRRLLRVFAEAAGVRGFEDLNRTVQDVAH